MRLIKSCGACALPLPDLGAKQCGSCKTGYCGPECQKQHWREGGHDKLCKKIKKAGGAEQYYADKKCAEAIALAVEECADDTKGQTCFICTEALHRKTKEGLVRGCACRGTAGFVHVSCLAEQAKILMDEVEENNLGTAAVYERFRRWDTCSLCEQEYFGVVLCALGWACWRTYVGRPDGDEIQCHAINLLGNGLSAVDRLEDELSAREAELSTLRRLGGTEAEVLGVLGNLAITYSALGRPEALQMARDVYNGYLRLFGEENKETLLGANNYAKSLIDLRRFGEARSLLCKTLPVAQSVLGDNKDLTLWMRWNYAEALYKDEGATFDDLSEAVDTLAKTAQTARRVLGRSHPDAVSIKQSMQNAFAVLRAMASASEDPAVRLAVALHTALCCEAVPELDDLRDLGFNGEAARSVVALRAKLAATPAGATVDADADAVRA